MIRWFRRRQERKRQEEILAAMEHARFLRRRDEARIADTFFQQVKMPELKNKEEEYPLTWVGTSRLRR